MSFDLFRFDALPVSAWRNGAGRKADIASSPEWHIGFAWLDADAPFSDFSGHDRTITLVDGAGFVLEFADQPALQVAEPYHPSSFDGGWPTQCRLPGGGCLVLNAMTARAHCRHTITVVEELEAIDGRDVVEVFLVLLTGTATVLDGSNATDLQPRDAIHVKGPLQLRTSREARLCLIRIDRT